MLSAPPHLVLQLAKSRQAELRETAAALSLTDPARSPRHTQPVHTITLVAHAMRILVRLLTTVAFTRPIALSIRRQVTSLASLGSAPLNPRRRVVLRTLGALGLGMTLPSPAPITAKPKRCKHGKKRCQGRCIPQASCCTDADCVAPQHCAGGACVSAGCTSDAQCPAGQQCIGGTCRDRVPCGTNAGCSSDEVCWAFVCTPAGGSCPGDGDCPYNQVCRDGQCLGGGLCFLDDNCRAAQVCAGGVCQGGESCTTSMQCQFGQTCLNGVCQGGQGD